MRDVLIVNAHLIRDSTTLVPHGWMHVSQGRITALGAGTAPVLDGAEIIDAAGAFVAPGFVSTHSHLFTSASRGLGASEYLYGWASAMYAPTAGCTPEQIYWHTLHGALDVLANGVTTLFDFNDPRRPWAAMVDGRRQELPPLRPFEFGTAQIDAKVASGLRTVTAIQLESESGSAGESLENWTATVEHLRAQDRSLALDAAVYGAVQWADDPATAELEVRAMGDHHVLNQAHFLETPEHVELQRSKFAWYADAGALGPSMIFGHFVQTTPEIVAAVADSGSAVSWQPVANGRLGSGFADVTGLRAAGVRVGIGIDDQACTDLSDPWQAMRFGLFGTRAHRQDPTSLTPADVFAMATQQAADVLGIGDRVGSLDVGKYADFVVVDPRDPDVGPVRDPLASYVLSMSLRNLRSVYVGGRAVAHGSRSTHPLADECRRRVHDLA
ncbi:amidohydrolase family protein [Kineosporia succinea]|uniref:Cytosine/adenosine deaminase-related metal-dependent hydrolase n=1 Tax=Kineosporia succinea TaxID=84632 RepID=A0ABT9PAV0_9ACTN|nr:amidohydrolase family protein [Kineosporia succinea]MDP9829813.1 cytosine/adenosine deaminase-related metal-dependent hydrolase [Kineosporia succinea]